jgi:lipopolysaccharide biosynthesis glycosyltransferase
MTLDEILVHSYVVTSGGDRLLQFRRCLAAVGIPADSVKEWTWCHLKGEGRMGNAISQYSIVRHALEAKLPHVVIFEDDAVPCDGAAEKLVEAFETRDPDTLCLSLGWSWDSDPEIGNDRTKKQRVYGSQAYALFGERGYRAYMDAWEKFGYADIVLALFNGSKMAKDNIFVQHVPTGDREYIHHPCGWSAETEIERVRRAIDQTTKRNVDKGLDNIVNDIRDQYSKARAEIARIDKEREMHVVYTVDVQGEGAAGFVDQLLASVFSVREARVRGDRVAVHILYGNIPGRTMDAIQQLQTPEFRVEFKRIKDGELAYMQSLTTNDPTSSVRTWNGIVFARLWIPLAFPEIDRAIYLDADTLVLQSLRGLWGVEFAEGKMLGMTEPEIPEYGCNSGVMLIDCAMMRKCGENGMWSELSKFLEGNARSFYLPDQTAINRFWGDCIMPIPGKWCYAPRRGRHERERCGAAILHFYVEGAPRREDDAASAGRIWNDFLKRAEEMGCG